MPLPECSDVFADAAPVTAVSGERSERWRGPWEAGSPHKEIRSALERGMSQRMGAYANGGQLSVFRNSFQGYREYYDHCCTSIRFAEHQRCHAVT